MTYLLDTNAVIRLLNDPASRLAERVRSHRPTDVGISTIVVHELFNDAFKGRRPTQNVALVEALLLQTLDFDKEDARHAGEIRAFLANNGTPIGPYDVLIAGQAKARDLILVTHNTGEFQRVPGLLVEDWDA